MSDKNYDSNPRWYVVHTYSGYENKVKTDLENKIKNRELEDFFFEIVVPMEEQIEIKDGKKIYTVDNYSYNSLEELVKNMPVLFTDEDENYDYDEGWEDLEESKNNKKLEWFYNEEDKVYHCEINNWYFNILYTNKR